MSSLGVSVRPFQIRYHRLTPICYRYHCRLHYHFLFHHQNGALHDFQVRL